MKIFTRSLKVIVGLLILMSIQTGEGKILGFYDPITMGRIGFDIATLGWYWLCLWLIYRGIKPKQKRAVAVT